MREGPSMRHFLFGLTIAALSCAAAMAAVPVNRTTDVGARAKKVDSIAVDELGLHIRDLAVLLDAGPNHFRPKASEEMFGTLEIARKLEAAGYITIETTKGLPDGQEGTTEFLSYVPTQNGQAVIDALK